VLLYYLSKIRFARVACVRRISNDESQSSFASYLVSDADDGSFGDSSMFGQMVLNLAWSDLIALQIERQ
jgi:hypothetical protein